MEMTHYYKFVTYCNNGNTGNTIKFCLSNDDIDRYKKEILKDENVFRVEVYRQYVSFELINIESREF